MKISAFLSAALFAFGAAIFALPAGEAVAQTISEEGCPLRVAGSVYNPADEACDCPGETQIFEFRESEAPGARLYEFCAVPLTDAQCDAGMSVDLERNICACSTFGHRNFETGCAAPVQCNGGIVNGNNECECATGFTLNGGNCDSDAASLEDIPQYEDDDCAFQGWFTRSISDGTNSASVCDIPLVGQPDSGPVARQFSASVRTMGCVLRADSGFDFSNSSVSGLPLCGAADVFGGRGIPKRPVDFNPVSDRIALSCPGGQQVDPNDPRTCVARTGGGGGGGSSSSDGVKTDGAQRFALGVGIIILAGAAFGVWEEAGAGAAFSMTPTADYGYENGEWHARHGTRLNYHGGGDWSLWWSAEGLRRAEDAATESRFGWGGEWRGDNLRLDAAALVTDAAADFRASAAAEWDFDGLALRPSWQVRTEALESGDWDSRMDANIAAEWGRLGWKISPSFGATGSLRDAQADGAFMRLKVERTLGW